MNQAASVPPAIVTSNPRKYEAEKLLSDREVREINLMQSVQVNGREKQIKIPGPRRITFQDSKVWAKVYKRSPICQSAKGPGMPVMNLVSG